MKIAVLSTFDIYPVNDGGRQRYNSMMKPLSRQHDVILLAYHLEDGESTKRYRVADRFKVVSVPARWDDYAHCWSQYSKTQRIAHDIFCIRDYSLSEEFRKAAATIVGEADVVVVAHPYFIITAKTYARKGAILVYESFNVEFDAKIDHFSSIDPGVKRNYLGQVFFAESLACRSADYVTAVSGADADRLSDLYGIDRKRVTVLPNGVDVQAYPPFSTEDRMAFRTRLGIAQDRDTAVFVGSAYGPNVDAYRKARILLSAAGFKGAVVLVGSIAQADHASWDPVSFDEIWLGFVEEEVRVAAVCFADFALHFMFEGAGTNLKLFDYMAARTLIIANAFAVRGVEGDDWYIKADTVPQMEAVLNAKPWHTEVGKRVAARARDIAEQRFDWRAIAEKYDLMISGRLKG